jgi:hypothetical protein
LIGLASAASGEMSFKATVDKLQAAYEDRFQLLLEVTVSDASVKTTPIPPPEIVGFQIGGSGSSVERRGDQVVRRYVYDFMPRRSGAITIPAFKVEFQSATTVDTLLSDPITVEVAQPNPIKQGGASTTIIIISALVVIGVVGGFAWWRFRSRPAITTEPEWRDEYRAKFAEIRKLADRQDFRQYSVEVMRLIVSIVERTYETRLAGFTSSDLVTWLAEKNMDKECLAHCRELFDFCEGVKYSSGKVEVQAGMRAAQTAGKIVELLLK